MRVRTSRRDGMNVGGKSNRLGSLMGEVGPVEIECGRVSTACWTGCIALQILLEIVDLGR